MEAKAQGKIENQSLLQEDGPLETTNMEPPGAKMERRQFQTSRQKTLLTFRCHRRHLRRRHHSRRCDATFGLITLYLQS